MVIFAFKLKNDVLFEIWGKVNSGHFVVMQEVVLVFIALLYDVWAVLGGVTRNNMSLTRSNGRSMEYRFSRG